MLEHVVIWHRRMGFFSLRLDMHPVGKFWCWDCGGARLRLPPRYIGTDTPYVTLTIPVYDSVEPIGQLIWTFRSHVAC